MTVLHRFFQTWLRPGVVLLLAALLLIAGVARSGEEEDLYSQLMRRYDRVNDELLKAINEYDGLEPLPELPERVLSLRKNAVVTIGGEMRLDYEVTKASWKDPGFEPGLDGKGATKSRMALFGLSAAKLLVDARLQERWRLFFDLDFSGDSGRHRREKVENPNRPGSFDPSRPYRREVERQPIQQAYIEFMKDRHSGPGFLVGWMKLPFGLWDKPNLFAQSYLDGPNLRGSYLMGSDGWSDAQVLPHASRFMDPAMAFLLNYEFRDIIRLDAALFQEQENQDFSYDRNGHRERRSDSHFPRSWQVGLSLQPLEGWELTAHFRNRYSRSRGIAAWANTPSRWDFRRNLASGTTNPKWSNALGQWTDDGDGPEFGATTDEQAFIVGLAVEIPNTDLAVRVEYAHGWNQGFNKHINSDDVNVGLSYRLTPRLTLHAQGEWLDLSDRSWMAEDGAGGWRRDKRKHDLYRGMLGAEFEFAKGAIFEAGWQYEYWKIRSARGGVDGSSEKRVNRANTFYLGTRFIF